VSLLDVIAGSEVAVVDVENRLLYAWFGHGAGVNIYDEDGNEVDYFTVGGDAKPTERNVRRAIASVIADREREDR
jgi:hypothetical protein